MQYCKVEICGVNTSKLKVLREKEKIELLKLSRQGDKKARDELINGNLRLVLSVVQRFVNRGENLDDLFQVGCIGLIKAIDNFDISQNVRFSTYAVPMTYSSRETKKEATYMAILSTAQAIDLAIESIEIREDIPPQTKREAVGRLERLQNRDYYVAWSKEKIIKKINEWTKKNGRPPRAKDFNEFGMPHPATVRHYFGMTPAVLIRRIYPELIGKSYTDNKWGYTTREEWIRCFREQFNKHSDKIINAQMYDSVRDKGTPSKHTIIQHLQLSGWNDLMKIAEVKYKQHPVETAHVKLIDARSPILEKIDELNKERDRHLKELYEVAVQIKV